MHPNVTKRGAPARHRTLKDYWRLVIRDDYSIMRIQTKETNHFELNLALITMIQQNQFLRHPDEDPNENIGVF